MEVLLIIILILLILSELEHHNFEKMLESTCEWCDAQDEIQRWIDTHPTVSRSHPVLQKLFKKEEEAYQNYLRYHPYLSRN